MVTINDLKERVSAHAYAMDMDVARLFAELTGRPETEVLSVIRNAVEQHLTRMNGQSNYKRAVKLVCEDLAIWYESADQYAVTDLIGFITGHNSVCVYAVLVGQQKKGKR